MTEWQTPQKVSESAGRHITTVWLALESGELHGHQRARRGRWSIHPDAVDAWIRGLDGAAACGCARVRLTRRAS